MYDFHMHTTHSDGIRSVAELVAYINSSDIQKFSITDHNSVAAYLDPAFKACTKEYVLGSEICAEYGGINVEVLAYDFDLRKLMELDIMQETYLAEVQSELYPKLMQKAFALGLVVQDRPMRDFHLFAHAALYLNISELPENRAYLERLGYTSLQVFARKSSGVGAQFYMPSVFPPLKDVVAQIRQAGGKAVLAHPYVYLGIADIPAFVASAHADAGLDGVEVFYPVSDSDTQCALIEFCKANDLIMTSGSDYHRGPYDKIGSVYDVQVTSPKARR